MRLLALLCSMMMHGDGQSRDVAFESEEEISRKLVRYEQLFQNRYTEADEGYRLCLHNSDKSG